MHFVSHDVMTPICLATVQLQFVMQASQCRLHFRQTQHTDCMHVEERSLSVCSSTCVGRVCVHEQTYLQMSVVISSPL